MWATFLHMGTTPTTQRVAANVRAELAARQISGTALASALGIARSTMYRYLDGTSPWPVNSVEAVANFLEVPVQSLFAERGQAA